MQSCRTAHRAPSPWPPTGWRTPPKALCVTRLSIPLFPRLLHAAPSQRAAQPTVHVRDQQCHSACMVVYQGTMLLTILQHLHPALLDQPCQAGKAVGCPSRALHPPAVFPPSAWLAKSLKFLPLDSSNKVAVEDGHLQKKYSTVPALGPGRRPQMRQGGGPNQPRGHTRAWHTAHGPARLPCTHTTHSDANHPRPRMAAVAASTLRCCCSRPSSSRSRTAVLGASSSRCLPSPADTCSQTCSRSGRRQCHSLYSLPLHGHT
jgi:hypothetical protein